MFAGLSTVEAYNAKTDEWFHVLPMSTRRSSVGVGVVNGEYNPHFSFYTQHLEIDQRVDKKKETPCKPYNSPPLGVEATD